MKYIEYFKTNYFICETTLRYLNLLFQTGSTNDITITDKWFASFQISNNFMTLAVSITTHQGSSRFDVERCEILLSFYLTHLGGRSRNIRKVM